MPAREMDDEEQVRQGVDYNVAMRRLFYMVGVGCLIILIYALKTPAKFLEATSVGLMSAGAAVLTGGLLGFLFGVPHTKDDEEATSAGSRRANGESETERGRPSLKPRYRHNTSLEQISDWLTKIIVGVSLVEIVHIWETVWVMAKTLGWGLGGGEGADAFGLALLTYFFVCGIVFGFLWARLYLPMWFQEVDQLQALGKKVSQLEKRQLSDAKALALVIQQLNRTPDDPEAAEQDIAAAIRSASQAAKAQIFGQAQKASENDRAEHYDLRVRTAIAIFRGLIASDVNERDHNVRAELGYALFRKTPRELVAAEEQMSKAIEIRDKLAVQGWKYYEMRRARYRILQDPEYLSNKRSEGASLAKILADLRAAHTNTEKWNGWIASRPEEAVRKWLELNDIDAETLNARAPS